MIVDTSVLVSILFREADSEAFKRELVGTSALSISAGNWLELHVVLVRRSRSELLVPAERLLKVLGIRVVAVSVEQVEIARRAYLRFGQGAGHPAKLNFGDCFAYALAEATGESLLFKGNDFSQTDLKPAL